MRVPPDIINYGVQINGVHTDPVTYILFILSTKFERLEDERQLTSGVQLIDFHVPTNERIDVTLTRFEMARMEAQSVGFDIPNFQLLTTILFRALGVGVQRAMQLLQPLNHQMPRTQQQYNELLGRMRSVGHIAERSPGNIAGVFGRGRGHSTRNNFYTTLTTSAEPGDGPDNDAPAGNIWADPPAA